jgi:MarR family transcriptional regulator, 2-MHQ and catechol-resistance regulon repressor
MRLLRSLVECHDGLMGMGEEKVKSYGLTAPEFDLLVTLGVDQPLRMCELAERSLKTRSHTTQVAKCLEARGLVERQRSPESDREVLASLTAEGQKLFEEVYTTHYWWLKGLFDGRLPGEEQEQLTALLRKLSAAE